MKEIKVTNEYEKFKKLKGNRAVTEKRKEKIKNSILKVGYITSPILVNENFEIIDGQGRFEALKELQLPIEYIIQDNIGITECVAMNINNTNWSLLDYIQSYADKGLESYQYILDLMQEFNIYNISIISVAICGKNRLDSRQIKNGELNITSAEYYQAKNRLSYFKEILDKYKNITRINLLFQGLLFCCYINEVNLHRLKTKILDVLQIGKIPPIPSMNDIMQFIEEVYNKNSKTKYVYIYTEYRKQTMERMLNGINQEKNVYKYLKEDLYE